MGKIDNGGNRTAKSRKNQNPRRKGNLQVLGGTGNGHNQTPGDEIKNKKEYLRRTRKLLETKLCCRNLIKGRIQTNGPDDKKNNDDEYGLISQR